MQGRKRPVRSTGTSSGNFCPFEESGALVPPDRHGRLLSIAVESMLITNRSHRGMSIALQAVQGIPSGSSDSAEPLHHRNGAMSPGLGGVPVERRLRSRIAAWAACQPAIPWTPPPGGVDDEQI